MSDELMIQPQIQPQRVSAMPYVLGGAALGGVGAYAATSLKKGEGAKSYEELIQKANDADKVELTAKKEAVEKAEKELAEAGKAVYEGTEKEALDKAIQARDAELAKLTETKQTVIKKGGEIVPYDTNWSMTDKQRNDYQRLFADYETAKNNLETSAKYRDLNDAVARRRLSITDALDDVITDANNEIKPKSKRRKDIKSLDEYLSSKQGKSAIEDAVTKHKLARLTDGEIIKLGGGERALVDSKPAVVGPGYKYIPVNAKDGSTKYAKVQTSKMVGRTEYQKLMEQRTDEVAERISSSFKTYTETLGKKDKLAETIKIDKGLLRNLGMKRPDIDTAFLEDLKTNIKTFESDLKAIDGAKLVKTGGTWGYDASVESVLAKYSVDTPEEAKKVLDAKLGIGRKYAAEEKALQETIDGIIEKDPTLSKLQGRLEKVKRSDKDLNKITSQIKGQFKKYLGGETSTVTSAGLTAEQAMEKDSYKKLAEAVEKAQAVYDKVAGEKGKVNEGAKKAAEETVAKAKGELDKLVSDLGSKVGGMSNKAKLAWAAGTAVVGGLIGSSIANSKNKKIEEAAQNLYA